MWRRVKVKTKPTALPISIPALKARMRVDFSDEDTVIAGYLSGAIASIDGPSGIGYAMMEQTWELAVDRFVRVIALPGAPVKSITSIKYYDKDNTFQTLDPAEYTLFVGGDVAIVEPVNSWPSTHNRVGAVVIEYVLGESDAANVPASLIDAIALLVAHRYEFRQPVVFGSTSELPYGTESLISDYRRLAVA